MDYQIVAVIGWGTSIALAGTLFYMSINRRIQDSQRLIREEIDNIRRWVEADQDWMRRKLNDMEREMKDPLDIHNKGKKFYNTEA
jgi:hypothetical protein